MRTLFFAALLMAVCCLQSCIEELDCNCGDLAAESVRVSFDLKSAGVSRSSIVPAEDALSDFHVFVYGRGILVGSAFLESLGAVSFDMDAGKSYNVYALGNVGYVEPFLYEDDLRNKYVYSISDVSDMEEFLPLAGCLTDVVVQRSGQRFGIHMERLVSKVRLSVDKSFLDDLRINSVRLCQSALRVSPFGEGPSAVCSAEHVADGDYCTSGDLAELNAGGEVFFYALENCRGVLLPENVDPWEKVPFYLEDHAELCTYLEIECAFGGGGLFEGNVTYRIYLGQDNCTDFNVMRNSILDVSLSLTVDGLKRGLSWKVSADYSLNEGFASGWISRGMHGEHELYVGERFEYSVRLSDELAEYLGAGVDECKLCFRSYDGDENGQILFSDVSMSNNGCLGFDALCVRPCEGEICLKDKDGNHLAVLSDQVCINIPVVQMSDLPFDCGEDMLGSSGNYMECEINGGISEIYVYFVDYEGFNLNLSSGCGYDLSVFDFELDPELCGDASILDSVNLDVELGDDSGDGPVLTYSLTCSHDGRSHRVNFGLLEAVRQEGCLSWTMTERACGMNETLRAGLGSLPVSLTLVDNGWAGYGTTQLAMVVDNPSRLPLSVDCWQLMTVNLQYDSSLKNEAAGKVENELSLISMEYVVNQYNASSLPVYGSVSSFVSELNEFGTSCVEKNGLLIYNLKGLDSDDLTAALTYDGWGHDSMSHHVKVSYTDGSDVADLTVTDNLSGNLSSFVHKYDHGGLNDRGIWLYNSDSLLLAPENLFDGYPGLTPSNLRLLQDQTPVVGCMNYDKDAARLYIYADALGAEGLVLDSQSQAKADGYVQTYPDGTWGKSVDNYCHEELTKVCTGFSVMHSGGNVIADNNTVCHVFEQIYENTYYDSWNKIGSANNYWHSAHPTSLALKMDFKLSDRNDSRAFRFTPLFPRTVVFKHAQEGVEYTVPVDFSYSTYKFVEVTEK